MTDLCIDCGGPLAPCTCRPNCPGGMCPACAAQEPQGDKREVSEAVRSITARPPTIAFRPPTDEVDGYMLELFEQAGKRHGVWIHRLKTGSFRWKCSCGARRDHHVLDAALLAEARAHFEEAWDPPAVPIGHPVCVWNDRVLKEPPPTAEDLERLARDLFAPPDELARRRNKGKLPPGVTIVNLCALCGQTFEIKPDDPHWVTGRGPICPPITKEPA